jgi:hypothetical protein
LFGIAGPVRPGVGDHVTDAGKRLVAMLMDQLDQTFFPYWFSMETPFIFTRE